MVKVKICGITTLEDLTAAAELGADALGIVLEPTSPRAAGWGAEEFREARKALGPFGPPLVAVYGVAGPAYGADYVQHVRGCPQACPSLLALRPEPGLDWEEAADRIAQARPAALVTDSWSPSQFGGTGEAPDPCFVEEILARFSLPLILAGGLTPGNVAAAVRRWRPYAVDVSSGVERAKGVKDLHLVKAFIEAAKSA